MIRSKRREELELRVARIEEWLDAVKVHANRGLLASKLAAESELPLAKRVDRIEQALGANLNIDVTR